MKSNTHTRHWGTRRTDPTPTEVFDAVSHEHRQYLLEYLAHRPETVDFHDMAEYIAIREGELTPQTVERVLSELYHVHLPHLAAAGLVSYDIVQETIDLRVDASDIWPFLRLTRVSIPRRRDDPQ